jgi:Na+-transporting methylmalonyl-CoA/oxaloacetate decarboxylase gamma subunit
MNEINMNPFVITVVGLAVVMLTLAVLWFLAKLVSWAAMFLPREQSTPTLPTPQAAHSTQPSTLTNDELLVVLAAAATSVLGVPVRILQFREQSTSLRTNGWVHTARVQQMHIPRHNFGRK